MKIKSTSNQFVFAIFAMLQLTIQKYFKTYSIYELNARRIINKIMLDASLKDCYREITPTGGFTWQRGNIMSRLDMILVSSGKAAMCTETEIDWNI